jgi:hypothetical protein
MWRGLPSFSKVRAMRITSFLVLLSIGCGDDDEARSDAGHDAGHDAGNAVIDAGGDAGDSGAASPDAGMPPPCGTGDALALASCVERARYSADLRTIAMPREPESAHWQVVQDLCADRFEAAGFEVERHDYGTGVNVIGVREGTTMPAARVLVAAHYDHIEGCQGADDNASGVAGVLEVARVLSMTTHDKTLVVACWDEEERGLIGARAYAERARAASETIEDYFNFEMIGYRTDEPESQESPAGFELLFPDAIAELEANQNRGDFVAVIGDPDSMATIDALERHADRIGLPFIGLDVPASLLSSPLAGDIRRSDHAAFWDEMYPGMLITDTSEFRYDAYHCLDGDDVPENLDDDFATAIVTITVAAAAESLGHPAGS